MALRMPPLVEVLALEEMLERVAVLREGVEEFVEVYDAMWCALYGRRQALLDTMRTEDVDQVELLRAEG